MDDIKNIMGHMVQEIKGIRLETYEKIDTKNILIINRLTFHTNDDALY